MNRDRIPANAPGDSLTSRSQAAFSNPFLWPVLAAASVSATTASLLSSLADSLTNNARGEPLVPAPAWTTPNTVSLELPSMQLRDFSAGAEGQPTLLCAPYALHGANIVDFAPGHSLVEALRAAGLRRLFATDWRSATLDMRYFSIDSYLADINVAVDSIGPPIDIIGLCQGGWMALLYAARFPGKVRRVVLAGSPIDIRAGDSHLSRLVADIPFAAFENLVRLGGGRVLGQHVLESWAPALATDEADRVLQLGPESERLRELARQFEEWYAWTVDLPGVYYLEVVRRLFKENQIAEGRFTALGQRVDLAEVRLPMFLLAARDDELVSTEQALATADLVGTPGAFIETTMEPCGHLSLFLGADTLGGTWRRIADWLRRDLVTAQTS